MTSYQCTMAEECNGKVRLYSAESRTCRLVTLCFTDRVGVQSRQQSKPELTDFRLQPFSRT